MSPSSRRAWIEISAGAFVVVSMTLSPSSRRAWIEIALSLNVSSVWSVALLAEGVD